MHFLAGVNPRRSPATRWCAGRRHVSLDLAYAVAGRRPRGHRSGRGGGHHRARAGTPGIDVRVLEHEPYIAALAARLRQQGVNRRANAMGVARRNGGASAVGAATAFPAGVVQERCRDVCDRPGPRTGHARLLRGVRVNAIVTNSTGQRAHHLVTESRKGPIAVRGAKFVLAAGAVNSAALQLTSANDTTRAAWPIPPTRSGATS